MVVLSCAVAASLALGFANLGVPSLWHDELVHVYVAKSVSESALPSLPSGEPYFNGTAYHYILALFIMFGGLGEAVVRSPSVLFGVFNVLLTYLVVKPLLGRNAALLAAVGLAISPWAVAWSREARFYSMQQTLYLGFVGAYWQAWTRRPAAGWMALASGLFLVAVLTSYHSALFLAVPGALVVVEGVAQRRIDRKLLIHAVLLGLLGVAALALVLGLMNAVDRTAVVQNSGLGGTLVDAERSLRLYYPHWLHMNLSTGFFLAALAGFALMVARKRRPGLYATLAFWLPILALTFLVGYRRPRFMFFAYPFFVAAWAYAIVAAVEWLRRPKPDVPKKIVALATIAILIRLGVSGIALTGDSVNAASGAHTTLARRHPQWKAPAAWVREHAAHETILTTTYLPVLHYVGRVDTWYPSRALPWEADESGIAGLPDVAALQKFLDDHPRGVFLAEWWRFERNYAGAPWADFSEDIAFVESRMRRVDEASSDDVTVYIWGTGNDVR